MCNLCGDPRHFSFTSRRQFLAAGALAALATTPAGLALAADPPAGSAPKPNAITPAAALKRLKDGNARYAANKPKERDFSAGRQARAKAQYPIASILSCADSRVVPELAFDQGPGELFVVRVAGNIVNNDLLASLEYSVHFLGVPLVMVLGHSACGAVDAAIKVLKSGAALPGHLPELVSSIKPAVVTAEKATAGELLDRAIAENVRQQAARLTATSTILRDAVAAKKVEIVGGVYTLATGAVTLV